jgi:tRNA-binding protein
VQTLPFLLELDTISLIFNRGVISMAIQTDEKSQTEKSTITYDDFLKVDIRIGTIVSVDAFPEARKPAYKLVIDFGPEIGVKKSSAQITQHEPNMQELVGKQVLAVVNFPPKQIGPFRSEVLTLGVADDNGWVILVSPKQKAPNGQRLF